MCVSFYTTHAKQRGSFSYATAQLASAHPRPKTVQGRLLATGQSRRSYPALGRVPFAQGGARRFWPKPNRRRYLPLGFISRREMSAAVPLSFQPKPAQGELLAPAKADADDRFWALNFPQGKCPQLEIGGRRPTIPAGTGGIGTERGTGVRPGTSLREGRTRRTR